MQFNYLKSELIYFESHEITFNQRIILLNNMIIKSKTYICMMIKSLTKSKAQLQSLYANKNCYSYKNATLAV